MTDERRPDRRGHVPLTPPAPPRATRGVRRLFLDTRPLRLDRDYRWLWSGQVVNGIGNQITRIALPFQVYVLTGSTLAIAALDALPARPDPRCSPWARARWPTRSTGGGC